MTRYVTDTRKFRDNVALLRKAVGNVPVIGVVKCNGYGAGIVDNRLFVEIDGRKAPLFGRMTLSNAIADVTDIPCYIVTIRTAPTGVSPAVTRAYI